MPEFQLNTPPSARELATARRWNPSLRKRVHRYYDLNNFARGYIEAMFFTNGDTGDDREDLLNDLGVDRLTHAAVADIAADCAAFLASLPAGTLEAADAASPEGYGADQAGRDFWFTRQGHGVGFWDRDLGEAGDVLDRAAKAAGEAYVEVFRGWIYHR